MKEAIYINDQGEFKLSKLGDDLSIQDFEPFIAKCTGVIYDNKEEAVKDKSVLEQIVEQAAEEAPGANCLHIGQMKRYTNELVRFAVTPYYTALAHEIVAGKKPAGIKVNFSPDLSSVGDYFYSKDDLIGCGKHILVFRLDNRDLCAKVFESAHDPGDTKKERKIAQFREEIEKYETIGEHPNITRIIQKGSGETVNNCYIIMEYITPFTSQMQEKDAVKVAVDIAKAIAHAHSKGVAHKDIRPESIGGSIEQPKIFNFHINGASQSEARLSDGRYKMLYFAPEQIQSDYNNPGAFDQYSLGLTLYTYLTGRKPYDLTGKECASELIKTILFKQLELSGVDERIRPVLERAVQKKPEDRYASMQEFAEALEISCNSLLD
jgi:serine/threonine protein kinase